MNKGILVVLLFGFSAMGMLQQSRPVPAGVRQGEKAEEQGEKSIPPPLYQASGPSLQQVRSEAQDLATLAHSVPPEVDQFSKGMRPKDLDQKLKRIEKLSKRLRSELSRM